jgi:hypothetical protein
MYLRFLSENPLKPGSFFCRRSLIEESAPVPQNPSRVLVETYPPIA